MRVARLRVSGCVRPELETCVCCVGGGVDVRRVLRDAVRAPAWAQDAVHGEFVAVLRGIDDGHVLLLPLRLGRRAPRGSFATERSDRARARVCAGDCERARRVSRRRRVAHVASARVGAFNRRSFPNETGPRVLSSRARTSGARSARETRVAGLARVCGALSRFVSDRRLAHR